MKRFVIFRRGDLSATHDANQVNAPNQPQCEGVVFGDGTVVLRWCTLAKSTSVWADFETMMKVHGHTDPNSKHGTDLVWLDGGGAQVSPRLTDDEVVEVAAAAYIAGGNDRADRKPQKATTTALLLLDEVKAKRAPR